MADSPADHGTGTSTDDEPARRFGWSNMFLHPDDDPRSDGGFDDERIILVEYLRDQRLTLELKCAGLDADQLARRAVPPSTLSLLGLVRHLAEVERGWFRRTMAGQDAPRIYCSEAEPDGDFDGAVADSEVVAEAWRTWRAEVTFADRFVAESPDLGVKGRHHGEEISLRELLVHMIEEYARHNGHADLLRELIDGRVGQ
ncbi:DinB family protein [Micromonospora phytophila]|uniref:DinB family protein n=1 Tax=Micromonospora phytophila TaxID=709888 RepID=UPI002030C67B|nr:DinB family protein [Micromonospora phytophila]MCM0676254.1 DinB family protein [Micromonospora phytophila]